MLQGTTDIVLNVTFAVHTQCLGGRQPSIYIYYWFLDKYYMQLYLIWWWQLSEPVNKLCYFETAFFHYVEETCRVMQSTLALGTMLNESKIFLFWKLTAGQGALTTKTMSLVVLLPNQRGLWKDKISIVHNSKWTLLIVSTNQHTVLDGERSHWGRQLRSCNKHLWEPYWVIMVSYSIGRGSLYSSTLTSQKMVTKPKRNYQN